MSEEDVLVSPPPLSAKILITTGKSSDGQTTSLVIKSGNTLAQMLEQVGQDVGMEDLSFYTLK